jgi:hypothetical protein
VCVLNTQPLLHTVLHAVFWGFDYEALSNPRLLKVVRSLTLQ